MANRRASAASRERSRWRSEELYSAATADGRFRGNARRVRSLSEETALDITPRSLPPDWAGEIMDYNYAQGLLEQYE